MNIVVVLTKNRHETLSESFITFSFWICNRLVGEITMGMNSKSLNIMEIHNLYIQPEFRNKGYGTFIMLYVEKICRKMKLSKLKLIVPFDNDIAQKLYRKLGFMFTGDILEYCYTMVKIL